MLWEVFPNSPASDAGLQPHSDYLLGTTTGVSPSAGQKKQKQSVLDEVRFVEKRIKLRLNFESSLMILSRNSPMAMLSKVPPISMKARENQLAHAAALRLTTAGIASQHFNRLL